MKKEHIDQMVRGWLVGPFQPSVFYSEHVEVAVKHYVTGDYEPAHYHKISTEITMIITGNVMMNGNNYRSGDIVTILPEEITDFNVLENTTTLVVKLPAVKNDKYSAEVIV
ncbi:MULTISPECIES: hypothetical protein [Tatumella]|uniref:Cupin domain-containing protein n=3 Tax=Tatumella TaxID=82986 RepID=A0ABW1VPS9_9GAMM|nr:MULTISPECIES: hypothetical protein [unclassified Tatumella]MBS0855791.1 hypothetical protein [Tatumella sp. JGM16]MBS0878299.1 hypothetical protein [Tatumella sp. JGM82]MBS0912699.1 hypothetical protein [Tatumella sp. JGM91]MBS0891788.1 hypothetical protein [Tatumella sp. JGM94]MBS0903013.1 hypothetical protein [Tatumella sp. JGM100]